MIKLYQKIESIFKYFDKVIEILFLITFSLYIISITLHHSNMMSIFLISNFVSKTIKYSLLAMVFLCAYSIITLEFNIKSTLILLLLGLLLLFNYYKCHDGRLILIYCAVVSAKDYNYNKIIKIAFMCVLLSFLSVLIFRFLNLIPDISEEMSRENGVARHGLGFYVANVSGYNLVTIVLLYIAYKKSNISILSIVVILLSNFIIYYFTRTRFPFMCVNIAISLYFLIKFNVVNYNNFFIKTLNIFPFFYFCILIIFLSILYGLNSDFFQSLNTILTGRLSLSWNGFLKFGVTAFGQVANFNIDSYDILDSSYINALIIFGAFYLLLILVFFSYNQWLAFYNREYYLMIGFFIFALYSTFDGILLMFNLNILPITFLPLLIKYLKDKNIIFVNRVKTTYFLK